MTVNLDPRLIAFDARLERGAIMRMDRSGAPDALSGAVLHFPYNPETITRSRTGRWEARKKRKPGDVSPPQEVRQRGGQGSSSLLAEAETIGFKIVFDATEAVLAGRPSAGANGVLPQLAFLEVLSMGREEAQKDKRREAVQPVRPDELLLILGGQRIFPVVLTSLSITEQKFLPTLVPLRAEVDLRFTVLEPDQSAYRTWISTAFAELLGKRMAAAEVVADTGVADAIRRELNASSAPPTGSRA